MDSLAFCSSVTIVSKLLSGETNVVILPLKVILVYGKSDCPMPYLRGCIQSFEVFVSTGKPLLFRFLFSIAPAPESGTGEPFHPL